MFFKYFSFQVFQPLFSQKLPLAFRAACLLVAWPRRPSLQRWFLWLGEKRWRQVLGGGFTVDTFSFSPYLGTKSPYLTAYTTPILDVFFSRKAVYSDVHGSDRTSKLVYNLFTGLSDLLYRIIYDPLTRYHGHPSRFSELVFVWSFLQDHVNIWLAPSRKWANFPKGRTLSRK